MITGNDDLSHVCVAGVWTSESCARRSLAHAPICSRNPGTCVDDALKLCIDTIIDAFPSCPAIASREPPGRSFPALP